MDIIEKLQKIVNFTDENYFKHMFKLQTIMDNGYSLKEINHEMLEIFSNLTKDENSQNYLRIVFKNNENEHKIFKINIKELIFGNLEILKIANSLEWNLLSIDKEIKKCKDSIIFENDIIEYVTFRHVDHYTAHSKMDKLYNFRGRAMGLKSYSDLDVDEINPYNKSILELKGKEKETRHIDTNWRSYKVIGEIYNNSNFLNERYNDGH